MKATALVCLAVAMLAAGCSAGPEPTVQASASSSPAATPSPSTTSADPAVARVPEPPPATDGRAGATAFARYVLQAWIYALNTNDPAPLLTISGDRPCAGCRPLVRELGERDAQGWHVELEGVRVSAVDVAGRGQSTRVRLTVSIPESVSYNDDGSFRSTSPAHPRRTFEVDMVRERNRYRLTAFSLY